MTRPFFPFLLGIEHVLGQHPTKSGPKNNTYNESSTVTSFGNPVSRIRFLAQVPSFQDFRRRQYASSIQRCDFTLGMGPCGRTVTRLAYHLDTTFLTILQECAAPQEGEIEVKKFIYLVSEITGRVEVTSV